VGIVEITKPYYPDPTDESGQFGMVDVRAIELLKEPVTLEAIKHDSRLADMQLVRYSRLSVQKVSEEEWKLIRAKGGL
jgi:predicted RNA-binding protein with PUA-like domain